MVKGLPKEKRVIEEKKAEVKSDGPKKLVKQSKVLNQGKTTTPPPPKFVPPATVEAAEPLPR